MSITVLAAGFLAGAALFAREMVTNRPMHGKLPTALEIASLPPDGGEHFNRLIHSSSPYLLQHAANPVDWYPWGQEAFERARKEDKPIFLSVGYSTCHWCHVMAAESFEDDEIARIMNEYFISIKVDREELPEVDELYMKVTQIATGSGGWPNSLWLTHDLKPWFAGTYFPKEGRGGRIGFKSLLLLLSETWRTRRDETQRRADELWSAVERVTLQAGAPGKMPTDAVARAKAVLEDSFDPIHGGFGGAPKFPPHASLATLTFHYEETLDAKALEMATRTLDAMATGGIRDHLSGGFHRYSTDSHWFLPHFEKMLYDNAQLAYAYANAYSVTGKRLYREVAIETSDWMLSQMRHKDGAFFSGVDADSEGEEGKFYAWEAREIDEVLEGENSAAFNLVYGIEAKGNFHDEATGSRTGMNVIYMKVPPAKAAGQLGIERDELTAGLASMRGKLLKRRSTRVRPNTDDKIQASWNGLAIAALAFTGRVLDEPRYVDAAAEAALFILSKMRTDGRLVHTWREGVSSTAAYLDDYTFLAWGLIELYEATGRPRWLDEARSLVDVILAHFEDSSAGGFFFTPDDRKHELLRYKVFFDRQTPSGNGQAALVLVRLYGHTGEKAYLEAAGRTLEASGSLVASAPSATQTLGVAGSLYRRALDKPVAKAPPPPTPTQEGVPDALAESAPVKVEVFARRLAVEPGGRVRVAFALQIEPGWHVNSNAPSLEYLIPTQVNIASPTAFVFKRIFYPKGKNLKLAFSESPLSVYDGRTVIEVELRADESAPEGEDQVVFEITWQACDDRRCLLPSGVVVPLRLYIKDDAPKAKRHEEVFSRLEQRRRKSAAAP